MTGPRLHATCTKTLVKFGRVVFELCKQINKDILITILRNPPRDEVMIVMMMLGVIPPGRASGISLTGNTASFRAALWTNLEKLADNIYTVYSQVSVSVLF